MPRQLTSTLTTSTPRASSSSSAFARASSPDPRRAASAWKIDTWPRLARAGEHIAASATAMKTIVRKRPAIKEGCEPKNHADPPRLRSAKNLALRLPLATGARRTGLRGWLGAPPTVEPDPGNAGAEEG